MVTETYLLALLTASRLDIVIKNLANMEQTLFETGKISEAGFTDPINVDQLRLSVSNLKSQIANLERQYQITMNLLKFQMGTDLSKEIILTERLENLLNDLLLQASRSLAFDPASHIDYKLLSTREEFGAKALLREKSQHLPSLSVSFTRQEMAMRNEFNFLRTGFPWFPSTYLGVNMNIPIFSSGLRSSRVQQAKLELNKISLSLHDLEQSLLMQLEKARTDFDTAFEQYNNQKGNMELAESIMHRTQIMHKEGLSTSLELTQANDQLLQTQANYVAAMFELLHAKNQLEKSLGR